MKNNSKIHPYIEPLNHRDSFNQGQTSAISYPQGQTYQKGQSDNSQWAYLQSIKKVWQCQNGHCEEKTVKCRNQVCDSIQNRFQADNYQPDLPALDPIPFPTNFNFAALFAGNQLPQFQFPVGPQFDSAGEVDLVLDSNKSQYYFTNAKIVNSKCYNGVCEVKTKTCTNGKCAESIATKKV